MPTGEPCLFREDYLLMRGIIDGWKVWSDRAVDGRESSLRASDEFDEAAKELPKEGIDGLSGLDTQGGVDMVGPPAAAAKLNNPGFESEALGVKLGMPVGRRACSDLPEPVLTELAAKVGIGG